MEKGKQSTIASIEANLQKRLNPNQVDPKELLRLELLSSLEKFTLAMFKAQYHRSFALAEHHKRIFKVLEDVVDGHIKRLIINIGPRYSKTEVVVKQFVSWCFALNPKCKFLHLSYSDLLVNDNSATIRSNMQLPLYKSLFPESALEREKGSTTRWKTAQGGEFYAVSTQGQVTGFGAGLVDEDTSNYSYDDLTFDKNLNEALELIDAKSNIFNGAIVMDDPMKPEDAGSDLVRTRINERFETTIRNRVNSRNTPIIIIMQRLHEDDLCGYLIEKEPEEWTVLSLPAIQIDERTQERRSLWPMKFTLEELDKLRDTNPVVFETQYMQNPTPKEGLMYESGFKTYNIDELPTGAQAIRKWNYTDTADTGKDFLCSISFIDTPERLYVTDVLYTNKSMEQTEPMMAEMLSGNKTVRARIESNNGGRGFARNIKTILRRRHDYRCAIEIFHQSENKHTRIYTYSANVMSDIAFPVGWETKYKQFYNALMTYRKENNKSSISDDAADCITGVWEMHIGRENRKGIRLVN